MTILGITTIYSAVGQPLCSDPPLHIKQMIFASISVLSALVIMHLPGKVLYSIAYVPYVISVIMLVMVHVVNSGGAAERWLDLGIVKIQPSELAKISTILALSRYMSDHAGRRVVVRILGAACITTTPLGLVYFQPDLGTATAFAAILLPMLFWSGIRPFHIFCLTLPVLSLLFAFELLWKSATPTVFGTFVITSGIIVHYLRGRLLFTSVLVCVMLCFGVATDYLWEYTPSYQKTRILTLLDDSGDPLADSWNVIQSEIAIGSGGVVGKGYLKGTQARYQFLPSAHTDFIFSVIAEEFGFLGAFTVLGMYAGVIVRGLYIGSSAQTGFSSLIAIGVSSLLTFHVFINVAMSMGIAPVTGLPLPFLSYGGSFLLASFLAVGLLLNVYRNRIP